MPTQVFAMSGVQTPSLRARGIRICMGVYAYFYRWPRPSA